MLATNPCARSSHPTSGALASLPVLLDAHIMSHLLKKTLIAPVLGLGAALVLTGVSTPDANAEPRNEISYMRGPQNAGGRAFFKRLPASESYSAGFHYHHGKEHDVLIKTPYDEMSKVDHDFNVSVTNFTYERKAKTGPSMELYGPYTARLAWNLYRTIDWTHEHHEQTYDIMASKRVPYAQKKAMTDKAVRFYLEKNPDVARSIAPLDVTMRRAGVMMKPYFTLYRNYSPESNSVAWVAHWWHPAIYEAQLLGGNGPNQELMVDQTNKTMFNQFFAVRPERMLLSREIMPRYSKMSPETANIFDNLHMLHGITYDIMLYKGYTPQQKRDELYRVIKAMGYQPGDEKYVRKFEVKYPNVDPRVYEPWMGAQDGEMSRIMREMMMEMMPMMMPGISDADKERVMMQFKLKNTQGIQPGEKPGSLHDAMMAVYPQMKMNPEAMQAGVEPTMMVNAMLKGWMEKYAAMPDIGGYDMSVEPTTIPVLPVEYQKLMDSWPKIGEPQYGLIARQAMPEIEQTTEAGIAAQLAIVNAQNGAATADTQGKTGITRPQFDPKTAPMMMAKASK